MSKQERNAPCACGSGKKYKKCCYLTPRKTGVSLHIKQTASNVTAQPLRPRRNHLTTLALLAAAVKP